MCFLAFKFSREEAIKFQKCFCVTLFQEFVTEYHLEYFGSVLSNLLKGIS